MAIDLIFLLLMILAILKGISRGFIVAVFSLLAFIIGLAAALKLSAAVAVSLHEKMGVSGYWLPVLSFTLVFIGVALLIRWSAALLKKAVSFVLLGWLDTIAGIVLYALMYSIIFSVILFFANRMHLVSTDVKLASKTYSLVEPLGPKVMSVAGKAIPFFSHTFADLSRFFEKIPEKI